MPGLGLSARVTATLQLSNSPPSQPSVFSYFIIDGTLLPQSRAALRAPSGRLPHRFPAVWLTALCSRKAVPPFGLRLHRSLPRIFPDAWLILHNFAHSPSLLKAFSLQPNSLGSSLPLHRITCLVVPVMGWAIIF